MPLPLPGPDDRWCLFLDFDGTLTGIAPAPHLVEIDRDLPTILHAIQRRFDGAVALVSGRPLEQLDEFLAPAVLPAAGLHGLEVRYADGAIRRAAPDMKVRELVTSTLEPLVADDARLMLEDKQLSFALHYRQAPDKEADCRKSVDELMGQLAGYQLLNGKMVLEIKPNVANKGHAIEAFLAEAPFAGRVPVFAGDDVTDEDGFSVVNARDGITIKVGEGATRARYKVGCEAELIAWLRELADHPF